MPINFDPAYTYQGLGTGDANELILREAADLPALKDTFEVKEGIKGKQAVHYLNRASKITRKDQGCNPTPRQLSLTTELKMWDPVDLEIELYECWKDLRGKILEWKLKTLNDKSDLTNTDIEDYLIDVAKYAAYEDQIRMAWFGDKNVLAANLTNGAADQENYNMVNGVWRQIFDYVAAGKVKRTVIADNAEATSDGQELEDDDAFPIFQKLFNSAPQALKSLPLGQRKLMTDDGLFTAYLNYRESRNLDNSFDIQESGVTTLKYRGVPIQVVNAWDSTIAADFFKNGRRDNPHRAILTQQGVLQLGYDAMPQQTAGDNPFVTWYDILTKYWHLRLNYVFDVQVANPNLIAVAY